MSVYINLLEKKKRKKEIKELENQPIYNFDINEAEKEFNLRYRNFIKFGDIVLFGYKINKKSMGLLGMCIYDSINLLFTNNTLYEIVERQIRNDPNFLSYTKYTTPITIIDANNKEYNILGSGKLKLGTIIRPFKEEDFNIYKLFSDGKQKNIIDGITYSLSGKVYHFPRVIYIKNIPLKIKSGVVKVNDKIINKIISELKKTNIDISLKILLIFYLLNKKNLGQVQYYLIKNKN